MTTIAYRDGVMASDSRASDLHYKHVTMCQKVFRLNSGALLGTAGDCDARALMVMLDNVTNSESLPTRLELKELEMSLEGLLVLPNKEVWQIDIEWSEQEHEGFWDAQAWQIEDDVAAVGSGAAFALGAMGHGADPIEAIRSAVRFDLFSCAPLQCLTLGDGTTEPKRLKK